jgi:hypothetical protein
MKPDALRFANHTISTQLTRAFLMTINRRQFLDSSGQGIGSLAAAVMLHEATATANEDASTSTKLDTGDLRGVLHHPPKVKRIIQLFMAGAASHIDLWRSFELW